MAGSVDSDVRFNNDFIGRQAEAFEVGAAGLKKEFDDALEKLKLDAGDPGLLASYQAASSAYNVFRNAASNTVKIFKDIDSMILQAAR